MIKTIELTPTTNYFTECHNLFVQANYFHNLPKIILILTILFLIFNHHKNFVFYFVLIIFILCLCVNLFDIINIIRWHESFMSILWYRPVCGV
jgi:hypothetical protein